MTDPLDPIGRSGRFSDEAWSRNASLYETIRTMPFNVALAEGSLPMARFHHYIVQDAHYLVAFAHALALAAAKADDPDRIVQFAQGAAEAITVERALHAHYFRLFGLEAERVAAMPLSPVAHHYSCFLIATGFREPHPVHLAALLPCFWIYREVGRDILSRSAPGNPYRAWIDTYAGDVFASAVDAMIAATDAAHAASPHCEAAMHGVFRRACQLEWMFWDSADRDAAWPI